MILKIKQKLLKYFAVIQKMNNKKKFTQETSSKRPKTKGQKKEETGSNPMNLITGSEEDKGNMHK